jgi:hypothetical protein
LTSNSNPPAFHILTAVPSSEALSVSALASARLRLGPAAVQLRNAGYQIGVGESISSNCVCLLVGKIGAQSLTARAPLWLGQIDRARAFGARIILDYTDHHLGFPSAMGSAFYRPVLSKVDCCVTSSLHLKRMLSREFSGEIRVIPDPIEISLVPPKTARYIRTILWFGHPSNVAYLLRWLDGLGSDFSFNLIALTNSIGCQLIQRHVLATGASISMSAVEWSVENMLAAARIADFCVLPSDIWDPRKSGASSNRLLTALALGLPTAASMIPSYQEFSEYFLDLDTTSLPLDSQKFIGLVRQVAKAQREVLPQYSMQAVGSQWFDFLDTHKGVGDPRAVENR